MGHHFIVLLLIPLIGLASQDLLSPSTSTKNYISTNATYYRKLNEQKRFEKLIEKIQTICPQLNCPSQILGQTVYLNKKFYINPAPIKSFQILNRRAHELVQVWGDTILESDYIVKGAVRVDSIQSVYSQNKFLAYKIIYSMEAYSLARCPQAYRNPTSCAPGRIYEASFISSDFNHAVIDINQKARFHKN